MKIGMLKRFSVFIAAAFVLCTNALADIPAIPETNTAIDGLGLSQIPLPVVAAVVASAIVIIALTAFIIAGRRR